MHKKTLLLILDGYGYAEKSEGNAVSIANTPTINALFNQEGVSTLKACGTAVGLPAGYMGNSEVGHLNIGSGRIVYQDMARIDVAIETKEIDRNENLLALFDETKKRGGKLHLLGLLSDAGVHSHIAHLEYISELAKMHNVEVRIHAFMDGRDTSPNSGIDFVKQITAYLEKSKSGKLASLCGRFYAMDRDKRWERVELAFNMLVNGIANFEKDAVKAVQDSYDRGETDEFIKPILLTDSENINDVTINDGDGVLFINFRADRGREIVRTLIDKDFDAFERKALPNYAGFATMVSYDEDLAVNVLFEKENLAETLGEIVSQNKLKQLRIAETEKYAHVTYFFNGGREECFENEDRVLVNSPKDVATYDLKPSMSIYEVTEKLLERWNSGNYDFVVCNFANPDMVGHTGKMDATLAALKDVDECVARVAKAVFESGGILALTADHGNADEMLSPDGKVNTAHSHNPVRFGIYENNKALELQAEGKLADIAPSLLDLWNINKPTLMGGNSLLKKA